MPLTCNQYPLRNVYSVTDAKKFTTSYKKNAVSSNIEQNIA